MARPGDEFLDPPASGNSRRPGDEFLDPPSGVEAPAQSEPSKTEAFVRGGAQGLSLGFADEIVGLGKALFAEKGYEGSEYRKARDSEREANHKAEQAHGGWYTGGNVVGGVAGSFLVPGGAVARGAVGAAKLGKVGTALANPAVRAAAQGAKYGAVAGAGESEATDVVGVLADAGRSSAVGGATAGVVGHALSKAPERAVKRVLGDITDGATATQRDRVVGEAGKRVDDVLSIVKEKSFKAAKGDAGKLLETTEAAMSETGKRLDDIYAQAGKNSGVRVSDVLGNVEGIAAKLKGDPGKADLARAVQAKANDVLEAWGNQTHVSPQQVRVLASDIADAAFRGSPAVAPKQGQSVAREVWGELKDLIEKNVEDAGKGGSAELRDLNKRMSTLMNIREAVRYKATREATESTRLKDRVSQGADTVLAFTSTPALAAKKTYDWVGKPLARAADDKLATLIEAANKGSKPAQIAERAIAMGFSPIVAQQLATWATKQLGANDAETY
jgi:hypothetical protein